MAEKEKNNSNDRHTQILASILNKSVKSIQEIEEQIKNLPADKGISLSFNPPGTVSERPAGTKFKRVQILRVEIQEIQNSAQKEIESYLLSVTAEEREECQRAYESLLNQPRDISSLQEKMQELFDNSDNTVFKEEPSTENIPVTSMSKKFSLSLKYEQYTKESIDPEREKEKDKDIDRD
jgi:hypothetical protein